MSVTVLNKGGLHEYNNYIQTKAYGNGKRVCYPTYIGEFLNYIESLRISSVQEINAVHIITYYEYISNRPNLRRKGKLSESTVSHQS